MTLEIGRLRTRTARTDLASTRHRIDRMLTTSSLGPPAMPPAAILVVRRIVDPLPGVVAVNGHDAATPRVWQRAVQARLDALYRGAVRPALGRVPPDAEAVLFTDRAELLACLALDLLGGAATERWWWRYMRIQIDVQASDVLTRQMIEHARYVPAMLVQLASRGVASQVVSLLSPRQANDILRAVSATFELDLQLPAAGLPSPARPWLESEDIPPDMQLSDQPSRTGTVHGTTDPPWSSIVPPDAVPGSLEIARQTLLGVALAVSRSPSTTRSQQFAIQYRRWRASFNAGSTTPRPLAQTQMIADVPASRVQETDGGEATPVAGWGETSHPASSLAPDMESAIAGAPVLSTNEPAGESSAIWTDDHERSTLRIDGISTGVGGVFYLLNLFRDLELLSTFEEDWRLTSQLGPWGILDAISRGLLATFPDVVHDEIWLALAHLAGRQPGDVPGRDVSFPKRFASPPDTSSLEHVWWITTLHPLIAGMSSPLIHCLRAMLPFVAQRLSTMLDPESSSVDFDPVLQLIRTPARLYITRVHLDVVFPLERISVPARKSGLDQNPGWLPDYGYVVQFHFE